MSEEIKDELIEVVVDKDKKELLSQLDESKNKISGLDRKITELTTLVETLSKDKEKLEQTSLDKDTLQVKISTAKSIEERAKYETQLKQKELDDRLKAIEDRDKAVEARETKLKLVDALKAYGKEKNYIDLPYDEFAEFGEEKAIKILDKINAIVDGIQSKYKGLGNSSPLAEKTKNYKDIPIDQAMSAALMG